MDEKILSEQAAAKRREYKRAWNAKNRDKCREHTRRYWEKKVLQEHQEVNTHATSAIDGNHDQ